MKKLRLFDSLKFVLATVACMFILNVAHADNTWKYTPIPIRYYADDSLVELTESDENFNTYTVKTTITTPNRLLYVKTENSLPANHKYFLNFRFKSNFTHRPYFRCSFDGGTTYESFWYSYTCQSNTWCNLSTIKTPQQDWRFVNVTNGILPLENTYTAGETITIDKNGFLTVFDLTEIFGAGNEPATAADAERALSIDTTIKIATTRYNEEQFEPVETRLDAAVAAVDTVVTQTMSQAQAIDTIATTKQTRPDEGCPPFKKCLLVEDEDGTPHWYEIYDPINDFLNPILAAAGLSGNQGAPVMTTHTENGSTIYDTFNGFFNGSGAFRKKYIDGVALTTDRPFGPTTLARCADNATRTTSPVSAGLCYNTGGMFRELTEGADDDSGEWALVWNGAEGGTSLGITPGVVYGIAKCTSVGQHTTEITGDVQSGSEYWWPKKLNNYSTTLASLIEQYPNSNVETVFNTLPNPYGTDDNPEYPRANYRNCWCKMTAIGVPGSGDDFTAQAANGTIMSVSGGWVFGNAYTSATSCANACANNCAYAIRAYHAYRQNVLTAR